MHIRGVTLTDRNQLSINEIATTREVQTLIIGEYDLAAELGMFPDRNGTELLAIRSAAVVASAGAGIGPPVGAADADFSDVEAYAATTRALKRMGFFGRATIHPVQVMIVNEVFTPTADEVEAASRLVAAFDAAVDEGRGVIVGEDGTMVDEALVRGARNTLETARRSGIL